MFSSPWVRSSMKSKEDNNESFIDKYGSLISLIVPLNEYKVLSACAGNYTGKESILSRTVALGILFFVGWRGVWASHHQSVPSQCQSSARAAPAQPHSST